MATFQFFFFSVQGTDGSPTGPDLENRVGDQDTGSSGRPVSSGLQVPCELGHTTDLPLGLVSSSSSPEVCWLMSRLPVLIRVNVMLI